MKNTDIGKRIKSLRVNHVMSQQTLGEILGIGQKAVSFIENGVNMPTIAQLEILSDRFDVSIDWIVKGVDAVAPNDRELLNAVKEDNALYNSVVSFVSAKKNVIARVNN